MPRRVVNKMLRRAEEAYNQGRYAEAEALYRVLLNAFERSTPTLLNHAAGIYGMIKVLHALGECERAIALADNAVAMLAVHQRMPVAA